MKSGLWSLTWLFDRHWRQDLDVQTQDVVAGTLAYQLYEQNA